MTSHFAKYKETIINFIDTRSIISSHEYKDVIIKLLEVNDYILPIIILTLINGQQKKNKIKNPVHGYDIAVCIALLVLFLELQKYHAHIETKLSNIMLKENIDEKNVTILLSILPSLINASFNKIIEMMTPTSSSDVILKISTNCTELFNKRILKIVQYISSFTEPDLITDVYNSDLKSYHFEKNYSRDDLKNVNYFPKDFLLKRISKTYGNISKLVIALGWIIGYNTENMTKSINRLGYYLSILINLSEDFVNLNTDMEKCVYDHHTYNYIINYGLQDSFELFDECKKKFYEGILTLNINTLTLKEILTMLEKKVMNVLMTTTPEILRTSSASDQ